MQRRAPSSWSGLAAFLAVAFATIFTWWAYRDFTTTFFAFDDFWVLEAADRVWASGDWSGIFVPTHGFMQYRPLTTVGWFTLQRALWDIDPAGYYVLHLAVQAVNVVLAYAIGRRLLDSPAAGLAVAVVYATAPGHALTARWLSQVIVGATATLYFLGLWLWLRPSPWRWLQASVVLVMGLLASEHAVTLPIAWTVLVLLGPERWAPRDAIRTLALPWTIMAAYLAGKAWYTHVVLAATPLKAAVFWKGYEIDLTPRPLLTTFGRYLTQAVDLLYDPRLEPQAGYRLGVALVVAATLAGLVVLVRRETPRAARVAAIGLVLFVVGLGPVGLIPKHYSIAYVGIAALGSALALVGAAWALPRVGPAVGVAIAAASLVVYVQQVHVAVRKEKEIRLMNALSEQALAWLSTVEARTAAGDVHEILLPREGQNGRMFGSAHRMFLCAPYTVRTVHPTALPVTSVPGRLVLRTPDRLPPERADGAWLRGRCPPAQRPTPPPSRARS